MELFIYDTYEKMSAEAAKKVMHVISAKRKTVLSPASGDTPKGLYAELVSMIQKNKTDISELGFIGLDEWLGMNGEDEGSCRFYLDQELFNPLQINKNKIAFFYGKAQIPLEECRKIDDFILGLNGIDLAIVGLGMNGHVGMNEPGVSPDLHSHVAEIDPITQEVGQKYFKQHTSLTKGITLGLQHLLDAKKAILIANGIKKADIIRKTLEETITPQVPASIMRRHSNGMIMIDEEAAADLTKRNS